MLAFVFLVNQHYHLFPQVFGEIFSRYSIEELHLSLTRGHWDLNNWGLGDSVSPGGAELWIWFSLDMQHRVAELWKSVTNVLSGQFCSSLSKFADDNYQLSPSYSYRPEGLLKHCKNGLLSDELLRVAHDPSEALCTENLTPWWKLLPCKNKAGIGRLLTSLHLWNSVYRGITVHIKRVCSSDKCQFSRLRIDMQMSVVMDMKLFQGREASSINAIIPFRTINVCPLATKIRVLVEDVQIINKTVVQVHDIKGSPHRNVKLPLVLDLPTLRKPSQRQKFPFTVHKLVSDVGNEKCKVRVQLHNRFTSPVYLVLFERIPRVFHILASSFNVEQSDSSIPLHARAASVRWRSSQFEIFLRLAPNSRTIVSYTLYKPLQRWTSFPPDANHGVLLPSAVVTVTLPNGTGSRDEGGWSCVRTRRLYSEPTLVNIATPDFSMPYNVICLVCTVVAICFGSLHNVTCRALTLHSSSHSSSLARVKERLCSVLRSFRKPQQPTTVKKSESEEKTCVK